MSSFIEAMVMATRALRVWCCGILLWNTVNYSMLVDQSDDSISTILYNNMMEFNCRLNGVNIGVMRLEAAAIALL